MIYSSAGFILVNITAKASTNMRIVKSTMISNGFAEVNNFRIPTAQITIKTHGSRYLIINDHVFPTLNVDTSLSTGMNLSTP